MSQWLDEKYINLIGIQLSRFHKQSNNIWSFRCPLCGDSQKNRNKTRGYFFLYKQKFFFKCHNCNEGMSLKRFIREQSPELYREYLLDVVKDERPASVDVVTKQIITSTPTSPMSLPSIWSLGKGHVGFDYCEQRQLSRIAMEHLFFTDEWTSWIRDLGWAYKMPEDYAPRLVLPWFDRNGSLLGAQMRRIDVSGKDGRYVTFKRDDDVDKIYGLDRVNFHETIYIVEGPIDSWFLPNAVASMDSDLYRIKEKYFPHHHAVLVWDNEPRNKEVVRHIQHAVKQHVPVVIWPNHIEQKDLNDMAKANIDCQQIVKDYTFEGLHASLEFTRWNRLKEIS